MKGPLVSIVMPSYNSSKTIKESIESVLSQDYDNWELLITDDCSSDKTVSIVNDFSSQDKRVTLIVNLITHDPQPASRADMASEGLPRLHAPIQPTCS